MTAQKNKIANFNSISKTDWCCIISMATQMTKNLTYAHSFLQTYIQSSKKNIGNITILMDLVIDQKKLQCIAVADKPDDRHFQDDTLRLSSLIVVLGNSKKMFII